MQSVQLFIVVGSNRSDMVCHWRLEYSDRFPILHGKTMQKSSHDRARVQSSWSHLTMSRGILSAVWIATTLRCHLGGSRRKRPGPSREQCTERAGRKTMKTTRDGRSFEALESGAVEGGRLNDSATDRTLSIPYRKGCQGGVAFHYTPHPRRNKTRVVTSFASLAMPLHYQILIMDIPIDDPDDDSVLVVVILWDGSLSMSSNLRSDYGGLHWS
jgi:hypothetical protein